MRYFEKLAVWVRVLGIKVRVFPLKEKKPKKKKEKPITKEAEPVPTEPPKKDPLSIDIKYMITELVPKLWKWVVWIISHIRVYNVQLGIRIGGEDAADIACDYGKMMAYVSTTSSLLMTMLHFEYQSVDIQPDFNSKENQYFLHLKVRLAPIILVIAALNMLWLGKDLLLAPKPSKNTPRQKEE